MEKNSVEKLVFASELFKSPIIFKNKTQANFILVLFIIVLSPYISSLTIVVKKIIDIDDKVQIFKVCLVEALLSNLLDI